ncbi:MAG: metal ABC transporter permease [Spirochaetota bacterium]
MQTRGLSDRNVWIVVAAAAGLMALSVPAAIALGVRFTYTVRTVTAGGLLLGALSGAIGSFAVLRKQSLLSHAALPGVGIAFLVAGRQLGALLIGAAAASLLGVWFISAITRTTRLKQDSAMGIVLAGWFAIGIGILAFIQQRPDASQAGLDTFIFGQAASIVESDVRLLGAVSAGVLAILVLNWKEFKLVTFDPDFARANGYRVRLITAVLLGLIVVAIVLGLQLAGVVLMVGLLIAPGIAARQWTNRLEQMVVLAAIIGATAGGVGSIASALDTNLPTGPMIILAVSAFVIASLLLAPGRGVVWALVRRRRDRTRFAASNVLKTAYRYAVGHGDPRLPVSREFLVGVVGPSAKKGIAELRASEDLGLSDDGYVLTERGVERAQREEARRGGEHRAMA